MTNSKECNKVSYCAHADDRTKLTVGQSQVCFNLGKSGHPGHNQKAEYKEKRLDEVQFMLNIDAVFQNNALANSLRAAAKRGSDGSTKENRSSK